MCKYLMLKIYRLLYRNTFYFTNVSNITTQWHGRHFISMVSLSFVRVIILDKWVEKTIPTHYIGIYTLYRHILYMAFQVFAGNQNAN